MGRGVTGLEFDLGAAVYLVYSLSVRLVFAPSLPFTSGADVWGYGNNQPLERTYLSG